MQRRWVSPQDTVVEIAAVFQQDKTCDRRIEPVMEMLPTQACRSAVSREGPLFLVPTSSGYPHWVSESQDTRDHILGPLAEGAGGVSAEQVVAVTVRRWHLATMKPAR
ncbi:hypothetical protein K227x_31160 [Rubripirellula lacrimiformis]|uniref:Uncharacterized protein n=1 Tax=Rubripirellula lacrimiformis TaxID=1930273 RepID=A0A517NC60_9BACT|nr:hypothetical protein [Rubripirellula lacrimiformis]QDT04722.1 hypothetical protein K227x_31160 [Rubripirellula lacrimiformis]